MARYLTILAVLFGLTATADAGRPFTVDDLVAMQRISDPQVSGDGRWVAFVVTTMDLEENRGRTDLWLAATDGSGARRLTTDPAGDWSPRWGDAQTLYFLSSRAGKSAVWRLSLSGGEAQQVTDLELDVEGLRVDPAGSALYLAMAVFPDCKGSLPCTVTRLDEEEKRRSSGLLFDRLFVRHWDSLEDGRRNHIFRQPLDAKGMATGDPVDLMAGVDADCPTQPFGGDEDFAVSADGRFLVYSAKVVPGSEEAWSTDYDLYAVPTDASAPPRCLTEANAAWDATPVFSPDGESLAYLAMTRAGFEADRYRVMVMAWPDGPARVLTEAWDRSPASLVWSRDGKLLYATADNVGNHSLFRIEVASGKVQALFTPHHNASPGPLPDGRVVVAQDSLISPVELVAVAAEGGEAKPLTWVNRERLAELDFGEYRQLTFAGAGGEEVSAWLVYPVGFDPKRTYPLAFLIHGGPQGTFDDHWHYRWNPQIYACHGYATLTVDFHGSTGYGQDFTDAIRDDWGGKPYEDLMKGLDHALRTYSWIDPQRMVALGASYGGFMVNWIQGHTDRFKALVCHDGNLDEYMAYFDTEELWFPEWEHLGTPWDNPEGYRKHSPINHVASWKTPELVVHGGRDFRVVETQGLATFNALQRRGIPSRLLYFPNENHWVLKPQNSIQWHRVVLEWIDRWTAAPAGS